MYVPDHFREDDRESLMRFIGEFPLATFVAEIEGRPVANHFPMLVTDRSLTAHIPRSNSLWREIEGAEVLCIFTGPDAYISPSWYPSKERHGKVVPTWNYSAVHVYGTVKIQHDSDWKMSHLESLTDFFEKNQREPWRVSDAPSAFTEKMIAAIVGLEVSIDRIEGKFKLGQNRSAEDRAGAISGLRAVGAGSLAEMMERE